jgi:hypothetical protein
VAKSSRALSRSWSRSSAAAGPGVEEEEEAMERSESRRGLEGRCGFGGWSACGNCVWGLRIASKKGAHATRGGGGGQVRQGSRQEHGRRWIPSPACKDSPADPSRRIVIAGTVCSCVQTLSLMNCAEFLRAYLGQVLLISFFVSLYVF